MFISIWTTGPAGARRFTDAASKDRSPCAREAAATLVATSSVMPMHAGRRPWTFIVFTGDMRDEYDRVERHRWQDLAVRIARPRRAP